MRSSFPTGLSARKCCLSAGEEIVHRFVHTKWSPRCRVASKTWGMMRDFFFMEKHFWIYNVGCEFLGFFNRCQETKLLWSRSLVTKRVGTRSSFRVLFKRTCMWWAWEWTALACKLHLPAFNTLTASVSSAPTPDSLQGERTAYYKYWLSKVQHTTYRASSHCSAEAAASQTMYPSNFNGPVVRL